MRAGRALGALLPVLLLATGCGIRATDVVAAGEPARVEVAPVGRSGTLLYFVSTSTRLLPVIRPADSAGAEGDSLGRDPLVGVPATLALLFRGPTSRERAAGVRSKLPVLRVNVGVELSAQGIRVTLDVPVAGFPEVARRQLICTAARARTADRTEAVTITGTDGTIGPARCSV
ncbi:MULTISPECIES: hypothetical protein [unclassified Streptomyces]|uniref:hypothetical protein n=1 Tax=unclassified Streptomyces TaxID=2593676 RepID=UPI000DAD107F|nr:MULTISPECIES: hypothetical protein [unclassified Streptomyces]PZT77616.1 hypothetical protein DNK56_31140 [Streptomyces sp. AC1-42W]PZT78430.1 hypothetical protein DNK55_01545 [Streptomyces sp. AC1-42T]